VNIHNLRRISGIGWGVVLALIVLMGPFSPPISAIGWAGWVVSSVLIVVPAVGLAWLATHPEQATLRVLLASCYYGVIGVAVGQWLAGGWPAPYGEVYLPLILVAALGHPPSRFSPVFALVCVASLTPEIYAPNSGMFVDAVFRLIIWGGMAVLCLILMSRVRQQRLVADHLANVDALTQLANRRAFDHHASRVLDHGLAVAVGDLDDFKSINDGHGHLAGDQVLAAVARVLSERARAEDTVFRWGGDKFAILLPATDGEEAEAVCARLEAAVTDHVLRPDGTPMVITIGWAVHRPGLDLLGLVAEADAALLARKATRKLSLRAADVA
jgi:diguanylate cyclase (GGDEF)-like protein